MTNAVVFGSYYACICVYYLLCFHCFMQMNTHAYDELKWLLFHSMKLFPNIK